jgi:hypothetical protein
MNLQESPSQRDRQDQIAALKEGALNQAFVKYLYVTWDMLSHYYPDTVISAQRTILVAAIPLRRAFVIGQKKRQARRAGGQKRLDGTYVAASSAARMPGNVRVHHGRALRVQRWTFPEGRSWRKPAEAERPLSRFIAIQIKAVDRDCYIRRAVR